MKNYLTTILKAPYNPFAIALTILMYLVLSTAYSSSANYDPVIFTHSFMILVSALGLILKKNETVQTYAFVTLVLSFVNVPMSKSFSFFGILGMYIDIFCFFLFFVYLKELFLSSITEVEIKEEGVQAKNSSKNSSSVEA